MIWTDERVSLLKKLWSEGISAAQIAAQMGDITRSSVIGKAHRLELPSRGKGTNYFKVDRATRGCRKTTKISRSLGSAANTKLAATVPMVVSKHECSISAPVETNDHKDLRRKDDDMVVPISLKLELVQLNDSTCKWPKGNPWDEDFSFCGNDIDKKGPYCTYHSRIAYQPVQQRRKR